MDEDECFEFVFYYRFPEWDSPCPKCAEGAGFYRIQGRKTFRCRSCRAQISPLKGTMFERSHLPITTWLRAAVLIFNEHASGHELAAALDVAYPTAWRLKRLLLDLDEQDNRVPSITVDG